MKTITEINGRIRSGEVVVLTASEMVALVREKGPAAAAREVDVVTTGTFAPVCSCGLFLAIPQPRPRIKAHWAWINGVPANCGLGASELFLGASEPLEDDPRNRVYPGEFKYGGGHVIQELVAGEQVQLKITGYGQACHPKESFEARMALDDLDSATLVSPRGAMVNLPCGVNVSDTTIYTARGILRPRMANANYCTAGQLSPLLKDPKMRTIGPGTRIFMGGGRGVVAGPGLIFNPAGERMAAGVPWELDLSLMLTAPLAGMKERFLTGISLQGYGCGVSMGIGVPIPILDEDLAASTGRGDDELFVQVVDMANDYPANSKRTLGVVSVTELLSGTVDIMGQKVPAVPLSSRSRAEEICRTLKEWISQGSFLFSEPAEYLGA